VNNVGFSGCVDLIGANRRTVFEIAPNHQSRITVYAVVLPREPAQVKRSCAYGQEDQGKREQRSRRLSMEKIDDANDCAVKSKHAHDHQARR